MNIPDSIFCPRCNKRVWLDIYREHFEKEGSDVIIIGCPNKPCKCNILINLDTGDVSDIARKLSS